MSNNHKPIFSEAEWQVLYKTLDLPKRQQQVVRHLFDGLSDKQVAESLGIATPTVRSHLARLFARFQVQDRTELVLYVVREFRHASE